MKLENTDSFARFDDDGAFVEYSSSALLEGVDEGEIGEYTYRRVYVQRPETLVECPHNQRMTYDGDPILETVPDSDPEQKRATLPGVLVAKDGDDLTAAETVTMEQLREERTSLLSETDYVSLVAFEGGTTVSSDMLTYRQALRDLPSTANVFAIVWPTKPE
tara:strand:+ start:381 stop:866 length:486 start_codon:yes stop_codon:yes gene_type:complete